MGRFSIRHYPGLCGIDCGPRAQGLEDAKVLSWVHRIKRVREPCPDLWAAMDGVGECCGRRTATPSMTLPQLATAPILLSPKMRLEHRTKNFSRRKNRGNAS